MNGRDCDIAIVGGGLAGGLIALALARHRPELTIRLVESGSTPGGNHRWSWFASDLDRDGAALVEDLPQTAWAGGYEVAFPSHARHLATAYRSLASRDFAAALERALPEGAIRVNCEAAQLETNGVSLADGERITARAVIDCRGFAPTPHLTGGWQVFLGRHLRLPEPHGIEAPVIMDATVAQHDGYRFVYVLPLGTDELFIEDTYYRDTPELERPVLAHRIDDYCGVHGWKGEELGAETGVLPVVTGGSFDAWQASLRIPGVARAGARGGFIHPLTSYTLPFAVETALAVARAADRPGEQLAALLEARARRHWARTKFYRLLGTMLFGAAIPEERVKVFERFYRLPQPLIERFYAARSTTFDRARILCGKPPVPVSRALGALTSSQPPLMEAA